MKMKVTLYLKGVFGHFKRRVVGEFGFQKWEKLRIIP